VTKSMSYVQYIYEEKRLIVHMNIIIKNVIRSLDIFVTWITLMCC